LYYYQNVLLTPTPNAGFTRRLYSVQAARPQRAYSTPEDPTALPHRSRSALPHRSRSTLSITLCKRQAVAFFLSMLKTNAATWRSMRVHSARTARTLAICNFLERCGNAVRTPLLVEFLCKIMFNVSF